jgi:hypothetical protein
VLQYIAEKLECIHHKKRGIILLHSKPENYDLKNNCLNRA